MPAPTASNKNYSNLPSNSENKKTQEKNIQKVTTNKATIRKKSFGEKASDLFLSDDADSVKSYVLYDVLVPTIKKTISDIVTSTINMLLYGDNSAPNNIQRRNGTSYIQYSNYSKNNSRPVNNNQRRGTYNRRAAMEFDDILFSTRLDAENVLNSLGNEIATYGLATVADFYGFAGVESAYTDNGYGWEDVSSARIIPSREGFIIDLPTPQPID